MNDDMRKNAEGYSDPTAYHGTRNVLREEARIDKRADDLISTLKYVIRQSGFELIERIQLRDVKSGKEYR